MYQLSGCGLLLTTAVWLAFRVGHKSLMDGTFFMLCPHFLHIPSSSGQSSASVFEWLYSFMDGSACIGFAFP